MLGRVSGVFGVKGWVKLFSYTEPREAILDYPDCLLCSGGKTIAARWLEGKRQGKTVVASLDGVNDREEAQLLVGAEIVIPRDKLPDAGDGSYYWSDLEGLRVVNQVGQELGKVAYLLATGSHDVLVVQGESEILIPFIRDTYIVDVDLAEGLIRVDWEWD